MLQLWISKVIRLAVDRWWQNPHYLSFISWRVSRCIRILNLATDSITLLISGSFLAQALRGRLSSHLEKIHDVRRLKDAGQNRDKFKNTSFYNDCSYTIWSGRLLVVERLKDFTKLFDPESNFEQIEVTEGRGRIVGGVCSELCGEDLCFTLEGNYFIDRSERWTNRFAKISIDDFRKDQKLLLLQLHRQLLVLYMRIEHACC